MSLKELRALQDLGKAIVETAQELEFTGLVEGTAGNVSCIDESRQYALVTPTGVPNSELDPSHLPIVDLDGNLLDGERAPDAPRGVPDVPGRPQCRPHPLAIRDDLRRVEPADLSSPLRACLRRAAHRSRPLPHLCGTKELRECCVNALGPRNASCCRTTA